MELGATGAVLQVKRGRPATVFGQDALAPAPYTIAAGLTQPTAEQLRADSVVGGGLLTETGDLPAEVVDLATSITASATTPFDKAKALNSYFTDPANGFTYSLNVPVGNSGDALVDFLTLKQGYCEQYASAMGIMLRAVGVPYTWEDAAAFVTDLTGIGAHIEEEPR